MKKIHCRFVHGNWSFGDIWFPGAQLGNGFSGKRSSLPVSSGVLFSSLEALYAERLLGPVSEPRQMLGQNTLLAGTGPSPVIFSVPIDRQQLSMVYGTRGGRLTMTGRHSLGKVVRSTRVASYL